MINVTKINNSGLEERMQQFDLYGQMVFKGFESFAYQSQENLKGKQKQLSKISRVGHKLPKIGKNECFKFNSKVDFSVQRESLKRMGASEVGSMFIGADSLEKLMRERILKAIGREIPFEDNLSMRKGKILESLGFDEFVRMNVDNIEVLHKNKYANGVDKYNYFKKVEGCETLVGSTIDGWFVNNSGEAELLEIKISDNFYLKSAAIEYNKNGNFLEDKYFFKYYVQVQMQLLCTGLDKGNLFFIIGGEAINCVIDKSDDFISYIMTEVSRLEGEVSSIAQSLKSSSDIDIKNIDLDELSDIIRDFLRNNFLYEELCDVDFKLEFLEFVKSSQLEIDEDEILDLSRRLDEINALQSEIDKVEEETKKAQALELARVTKPIKDKLKFQIEDLYRKFSLNEHINYNFDGNRFSLDMSKRAIKDRFKFLSCVIDFTFSSNSNEWSTPILKAV
ncbi:DUF244 domain-containing protein [Borrelia puertoricensis]|uniref:DUF244 domain-containing protein n=1 Tax=Borrelia puertoricensis TaxID=2756107 RepID=UPI001FF3053F|nr:DUF244 domain-containing protein [Borrelia puertoricensis]UPA18573.1 DUF244 domain-containing protein [Borrelia puertoricensis]